MNILVVCPMLREYTSFNEAISNRKSSLKNKYKSILCGVGKVNAGYNTALELADKQYDLVVVIGYAAASHLYNQGDFIMPSRARYHDAIVPAGYVPDLEQVFDLVGEDDCTVLTGDSFIDKESAPLLMERFGKQVLFDMEAAAVAHVCSDFMVPCMVMKFISDIPTEENNLQSFEEFILTHSDFSRFLDALELYSN